MSFQDIQRGIEIEKFDLFKEVIFIERFDPLKKPKNRVFEQIEYSSRKWPQRSILEFSDCPISALKIDSENLMIAHPWPFSQKKNTPPNLGGPQQSPYER